MAKSQVVEIGDAKITAKSAASGWTELTRINAQLQVGLVSLCRDEALTVMWNYSSASRWTLGGDSVHDMSNEQSNLRLLKRVLQPKQQRLQNLRSSIENWEHEYRQCCGRTDDVLSDALRRFTLESMHGTLSLQEHLEFPSNRLSTYQLAEDEIELYLDF